MKSQPCSSSTTPISTLAAGNAALRAGQLQLALRHYLNAWRILPVLAPIIRGNVELVAFRHRRKGISDAPTIAVCAWGTESFSSDRVDAITAAYMTSGVAPWLIIDPGSGRLSKSNSHVPCKTLALTGVSDVVQDIFEFVSANPADLVHLVGISGPHLLVALMQQMLWRAKVVVDLDAPSWMAVLENVPSMPEAQSALNQTHLLGLKVQPACLLDAAWCAVTRTLVPALDGVTISSLVDSSKSTIGPVWVLPSSVPIDSPPGPPVAIAEILALAKGGASAPALTPPHVLLQPWMDLIWSDPAAFHLKAHIQLPPPLRSLPEPATSVAAGPVAAPVTNPRKLPLTAIVITWDIGHNPLGRSYMLAEALQRVVRNVVLVGFQFPRYGTEVWEPVREGSLPVIRLPVSDLPDFAELQVQLGSRMKADVVIACKPRLPSLQLGLQIRQHFGCPLIVDIDDHELSFFKNQAELTLDELSALPDGACAGELEPFGERWTRLAEHLCIHADARIVSNIALQRRFGGMIVPHARDEQVFDPLRYDQGQIRSRYGVPVDAKVMLFFGTPRHHKGINVLAEATARIEDSNFKFVVVGSSTDRSVTAKLDALAPGRIIYLPNQPFSSIPEILRMADVVCLPQDIEHAISNYQLPAKAIDAIAMSVPLLVSRTEPLMQLVDDGVAEVMDTDTLVQSIRRVVYGPARTPEAVEEVRRRFLARYSYSAIAEQMRHLISQTLAASHRVPRHWHGLPKLMTQQRRVLGAASRASIPHASGIDIVMFWKQNDSCLYGRRFDMVVQYLASRDDVRRVLVIDAPISEYDLIKRRDTQGAITHDRHIYIKAYEKAYGALNDDPKIAYDVFIIPQGVYDLADLAGKERTKHNPNGKPLLFPDYVSFLQRAFKRAGINPAQAIFWLYPKNHLGPRLVDTFKPRRVVVDVVDDHRAWPGVSDDERQRLTINYRESLARADLAFANCQPVIESMREFYPGIRLVSNGCDEHPQQVSTVSIPVMQTTAKRRKTIVFVGNLEKKIDIPLLDKLACRFEHCDIMLIGSTHANPQVLELQSHRNIRFLGVVPYAEIGGWLSRADVGIIPHLNSDLTQSMNPLKLYVYLSWFVPVVSTEVYNIDTSTNFVRVAADHETFLAQVEQTLSQPQLDRDKVQAYIRANSWRARFESHIDAMHQPLLEQGA